MDFFALHMVYACSHLWLHFPSNMMNDLAATTPEKEQSELEIHMLTYSPIFQTFFSFSFGNPYVSLLRSCVTAPVSIGIWNKIHFLCEERARSITLTLWHVPTVVLNAPKNLEILESGSMDYRHPY